MNPPSHSAAALRCEGPRDGVFTMVISGRLDSSSTGGIWRQATRALASAGAASGVVDASGIDYCDGSGAALFVHLREQQHRA
ncbi:MAG: STAS domain-containing protein, partial [Candidatus Binatia bacterium]|nr:STAS domain-containing protein [Candidatus Binatia bacterium]